jgi:hypothetical protein
VLIIRLFEGLFMLKNPTEKDMLRNPFAYLLKYNNIFGLI